MNILKRFVKDEKGMETVEWAVLAALIVASGSFDSSRSDRCYNYTRWQCPDCLYFPVDCYFRQLINP
ncbi:MAG: Flp family type IVb pilin [Planctomycetota bacterium]